MTTDVQQKYQSVLFPNISVANPQNAHLASYHTHPVVSLHRAKPRKKTKPSSRVFHNIEARHFTTAAERGYAQYCAKRDKVQVSICQAEVMQTLSR